MTGYLFLFYCKDDFIVFGVVLVISFDAFSFFW